jgi:serine/threonine-protein kinase
MQAMRPGLMLADRYRLVELLGSGGMSQVWRARDEVLGRLVAVKVLTAELVHDANTRDVLRGEARAMAMVSDPHIANVHDYGEYDAGGVVLPFVVLELVHGRTLEQALRHGPLPWPEAVRLVAQVASALATAHGHGVVHCDVTPANIVLTRDGVKVVDFGIATVLGANRAETRFATAGYAAPERYDPRAPVTPAVDVYSLGVVLGETLAGRPLDDAERLGELLLPLVPPNVRAEIVVLCRHCLATSAALRPRAREVATELTAMLATAASAAPVLQSGPAAPPPQGLFRPGQAGPAVPPPPRPTRALPTAMHKRIAWLGLAGAATVGLAVAALAITVLLSGHGIQVGIAPELSSTAATTASSGKPPADPAARPLSTPTGRIDNSAATANLRQAVLAGRAAGEIRPECAENLLSRIADLQRRIDRGDLDNARQRVEQIGEEIEDRAAEGDLTRARAAGLRRALAAVAF